MNIETKAQILKFLSKFEKKYKNYNDNGKTDEELISLVMYWANESLSVSDCMFIGKIGEICNSNKQLH